MAGFERKKPDPNKYRNSKNKKKHGKETKTEWKNNFSGNNKPKLPLSTTKPKIPSIDSVISEWTSDEPSYKTAHINDVDSISELCEKFINIGIYAEINKTETGFSCNFKSVAPAARTKMRKAKKEYLELEKKEHDKLLEKQRATNFRETKIRETNEERKEREVREKQEEEHKEKLRKIEQMKESAKRNPEFRATKYLDYLRKTIDRPSGRSTNNKIYVIELSEDISIHSHNRAFPNEQFEMIIDKDDENFRGFVYVGITGKEVKDRFDDHKRGHKSGRGYVENHSKTDDFETCGRLLTERYGIRDILGDYPKDGIFDSTKLESYVGFMLYKLGYHVWGPTGHNKSDKLKNGYDDFIGKDIYV